jgi:hypothetical protein
MSSAAAESGVDKGILSHNFGTGGMGRFPKAEGGLCVANVPSTQASRSPAGMRLGSSYSGIYAAHHGRHRMGGAIVRSFGRAWIVVVLSKESVPVIRLPIRAKRIKVLLAGVDTLICEYFISYRATKNDDGIVSTGTDLFAFLNGVQFPRLLTTSPYRKCPPWIYKKSLCP